MQNSTPGKGKVNWFVEVLRVLGIIGKVLLRLLSYVFNILMTVLLIGLITGIIVCSVFAIYINNYLDLEIDPSLIASVNTNSTTRIYYVDYETLEDRQNRNGTLVEVEDQRLYGTANSIYASYSQFPENLVNAFIAIEDHRFRSHNGVDWWTTAQAVFNFIFDTGSAGGSTITQQLIKNITDEDEVKVQRKVEEIFRALNLEKEKSKEEIIEAYLNIVFLGNGCEGVQSAANKYFDKDVSELSLVECAALAAIVKNPSQYEPVYHDQGRYKENGDYIEGNADRRWVVLSEMKRRGFITEAEMEAAQAEQLDLKYFDEEEDSAASDDGMLIYSWYTESLIEQLKEDLMEKFDISERSASLMILTGGLTIVTPMDPEVQATLEEVYENDAEYFPSVSAGIQPQSAMVVMDPYTGDVLGLVGGRGEKVQNLITNRASSARRPPGSSIKPLSVYAPAIEAGLITYGSVVDDTPFRFNPYEISPATEWNEAVTGYTLYPRNYPDVFMGLTTVNSAVERSVNTIAMKILDLYGIDRSFDFMKNTLHFDSLVESYTKESGEIITDKGLASLALGQPNYGVTVLEMTAAYCMFQNEGVYNTPNLYLYVLDSEGEMLLDNRDDPQIVLSEETASIMTKMLQNVVNQGTATAVTLRNTVDVAAKTGTTSADFDRYFVGYTPYFVGGVWTGYDYNQSLSAFGRSPSLVIWDKVMTMLHQKYIDEAANGGEPLRKFDMAPGVITAEYCKDSGMLPSDACYLDPRGHRIETGYFTRETVPKEECTTHVIVKRDTSTNLIACPQCNPADCVEEALIRVEDRIFPTEVYIVDAQYTYREMPSTVKPSGWWGVPFYIHMLGEGEYGGSSGVTTPHNAYCYFHCDYRPWGGNPPAEDSGWDWETSDETEAPETEAPETKAPETETPETEATETEAIDTDVPDTEAIETETPSDIPETDAPSDEDGESASVNTDIFTGDDWFTN